MSSEAKTDNISDLNWVEKWNEPITTSNPDHKINAIYSIGYGPNKEVFMLRLRSEESKKFGDPWISNLYLNLMQAKWLLSCDIEGIDNAEQVIGSGKFLRKLTMKRECCYGATYFAFYSVRGEKKPIRFSVRPENLPGVLIAIAKSVKEFEK